MQAYRFISMDEKVEAVKSFNQTLHRQVDGKNGDAKTVGKHWKPIKGMTDFMTDITELPVAVVNKFAKYQKLPNWRWHEITSTSGDRACNDVSTSCGPAITLGNWS